MPKKLKTSIEYRKLYIVYKAYRVYRVIHLYKYIVTLQKHNKTHLK